MKPNQGPWWCLVCLSAAFQFGSNAGPVQRREMVPGAAATREDVDLLTFGVIQLTDTLGQVNETTGAKVEAIGRSLYAHDGWLWLLGQEAQRVAGVQQAVKDALWQLQVQMAWVQDQSRVTQGTLARVEREDWDLWTRVGNVEEYLENRLPARIKHLQEKATEHSDILRMLRVFTKYQKESLDGEDRRLSRLQQTPRQAFPKTPTA